MDHNDLTAAQSSVLLSAYTLLCRGIEPHHAALLSLVDWCDKERCLLTFPGSPDVLLCDPRGLMGKNQESGTAFFGKQRFLAAHEIDSYVGGQVEGSTLIGGNIATPAQLVELMPFGQRYRDNVRNGIFETLLPAIGRQHVRDLDPAFAGVLTNADFARHGSEIILAEADLWGIVPVTDLPDLLTDLLLADNAVDIAHLNKLIGPNGEAALRAISVSPAAEIAGHILDYYRNNEIPEVQARRLQAAAAYPLYAGLIAHIGTINRAVDAGQPIGDMVAAAVQCQDRLKAFKRVQAETNPAARRLLCDGTLDGVPLDWLPKTTAEWVALENIAKMWRMVMPGESQKRAPLWDETLLAGSKGKFVDLAKRIVKEGADRRPPDGLGDEAAAHFKAKLNTKPINAHGGTITEILMRVATAFEDLTDEVLSGEGWPSRAAVGIWLRRVCVQHGEWQELRAVGETVGQMVQEFGHRIVLPVSMMAERMIAAPVTRALTKASIEAAGRMIFDKKNIANAAAIGRAFHSNAQAITASILSEADIRQRREQETETGRWRRLTEDRAVVQWMEFFGIHNDVEDYPPLIMIQEFAPGLMAVPLFNRQQLMEEGSNGAIGRDRRGVAEMFHCIGPYYSAGFIQSGGISQAFSVRRIIDTTYERVMTVQVRLVKRDGRLKIEVEQATGPHNARLSTEQRQQLDGFLAEVVRRKSFNPRLADKVMKGEAEADIVPDVEVPIEALIGYSPFPGFKTSAALKIWQHSGILPASAVGLTILTAAETPEFTIVRQAIRESIAVRTGMVLARPLARLPQEDLVATQAPIEVLQKPRRGGGIFTGSPTVGG